MKFCAPIGCALQSGSCGLNNYDSSKVQPYVPEAVNGPSVSGVETHRVAPIVKQPIINPGEKQVAQVRPEKRNIEEVSISSGSSVDQSEWSEMSNDMDTQNVSMNGNNESIN